MNPRLLDASPIVVLGMHRSGTRLVVDVLDSLGVFMGADRQADAESVTFMLLNEHLLHQCGAFWSEPMAAHFLLAEAQAQQQLAASVIEALGWQLDNYAGSSAWGRIYKSVPSGELLPFGWKDPRNTFTLPVWKHVFPQLRAVHVVRHGVDVAASLARRHSQALRAATREAVPPALTVIRDHALGILSSRRGWTLAEAFTMWEQYVEKARAECAALGERAFEVRYEALLTEPERVVPALAEFCRVPVPAPAKVAALLDGLERSRAFAFRPDPTLCEFAAAVRDVLARHGYSP
jgi:hypothetical protein